MFEFAWNLAAFIVAIGLLVAFHEFGHFWVARRLGVRVLRFSIGFGKPLWSRRGRDGVEYVIAAVPLGGYVKMLDEREGTVDPAEVHRAFNRQSPLRRMAIVIAGPLFNFIFALLAYWLVFVLGVESMKPVIAKPAANTMAAAAGLQGGETVVEIAGVAVPTWQVLRSELIDQALVGQPVVLVVRDAAGSTRSTILDLQGVRVEPEIMFRDIGMAPYVPPGKLVLTRVPDGPAAQAGLQAKDVVVRLGDQRIENAQQWLDWVHQRPGEVAEVEIERDGQRSVKQMVLGTREKDGDTRGVFGAEARIELPPEIWQDLRAEHRLGPVAALPAALAQSAQMSWLTLKLMYRMVVGDVSVKNISGPIQIAQIAGETASIGLAWFLNFLAIVSVSLFVLNLLPVPVLDGGHLLYYAIEMLKGSPLSDRAQAIGQQLGLTMLVLLMGLAFYNDIMRLIG